MRGYQKLQSSPHLYQRTEINARNSKEYKKEQIQPQCAPRRNVAEAIADFNMIEEGDRIMGSPFWRK